MNFKNPLKLISPSLFSLILICFFLPFTTISCQSTPIVTLTGYQLATGTTVEQTSGLGRNLSSFPGLSDLTNSSSSSKKGTTIAGSPIAGLILATTCAGIALGFIALRQQETVQAAVAGVGVILLLFLRSTIDREVLKQGAFAAKYENGYWLSLILFVGAASFNTYRAWIINQSKHP